MTVADLCRVSVHAPSLSASVDVVLPLGMELGEVVPCVVELIGEGTSANECWRLSRLDGSIIDESLTVRESGIRDGDVLLLGFATPVSEPYSDELSRFVEGASPRGDDRWPRRLGAVACLWSVALGATTLAWPGQSEPGLRATVAAVVAVGAAVAAVIANRLDADPLPTLTAGTAAALFGAIAGFLLVPGGPAPPNFFLAATVCSTVSLVLLHVTTHGDTIFVAIASSSVMSAIAAGIVAMWPAPVATVGTVMAALSLAMLGLAAKFAIVLTGLSPIGDEDVCAPVGIVRAERGHQTLTGLLAGFALSTASGTILVAVGEVGENPFPGTTFTAVTAAALLFRACQQQGALRSGAILVAGLLSAAAAFTLLASSAGHHAAVCLAAVALGSGALSVTHTDIGSRLSPLMRRGLDTIEYLLLAAVVPLGCWVSGAFGLIRGLNLS